MGEIAEMHLDGTLCERCGTFLNEEPPGFPDYCEECQNEPEVILMDVFMFLDVALNQLCSLKGVPQNKRWKRMLATVKKEIGKEIG